MKKSKILIPAVAVLALSVGASVTGTVAWFTSSRTATVSAGVFESKALSANLKVKSTALVGMTTVDSEATDKSTITVDGALTHGSYNAAESGATTGNLYVANISEHTSTGDSDTATYEVTGYTSKGTIASNTGTTVTPSAYPWMAGEDTSKNKIWYAVSWTVEISLASDGNASATKMVFVNFNKTTFSNNVDVNNGFRVALMDGAHTYIIGKDEQKKHVTGTTTENVEEWETYHQFGETYTAVEDNSSKAAAEVKTNGYLFELTGTTAKTVTCVAWYEGEDTNVVSNTANKFNASDLTLSFYCRQTTLA